MKENKVYIDPVATRKLKPYSRKEQVLRVLWGMGAVLFRLIPRKFHGLRCSLLRLYGAKIGKSCTIANSARVFYPWNLVMGDYCAIGDWALIYNLGEIRMGNCVTVSHQAHLCAGTHDHRRIDFPLLRHSIELGAQSWICADAFVGPGVKVGFATIVGARAVLFKSVGDRLIVIGNPAVTVSKRA